MSLERGWDLFDSDRGLVIQRDDEANVFVDDVEATRYAIGEANTGDDYALTAIECACTQDYARWEKFLKRRHRRR